MLKGIYAGAVLSLVFALTFTACTGPVDIANLGEENGQDKENEQSGDPGNSLTSVDMGVYSSINSIVKSAYSPSLNITRDVTYYQYGDHPSDYNDGKIRHYLQSEDVEYFHYKWEVDGKDVVLETMDAIKKAYPQVEFGQKWESKVEGNWTRNDSMTRIELIAYKTGIKKQSHGAVEFANQGPGSYFYSYNFILEPRLQADSNDTSETGYLFFGIAPDEFLDGHDNPYAGGYLYHWYWNSEDKIEELGSVLIGKGYLFSSSQNFNGNAILWHGTRVEMNTVTSPRCYSVEYFDGNGNMTLKTYIKAESTENGTGGDTDKTSYSAVISNALKTGTTVAAGPRGDYIVKVPSTPELVQIANGYKTAMFVSVSPFDFIEEGYILINVVPEFSQYRILGTDITSYTGAYYAVEIPF